MDEVTGHHIFFPPFHLTLLLDFQNNTSKNPVCIVISKSWYVCLKASQNDLRMHGHRLEDILPIPFWQNEGTHQWSLQFRSTYQKCICSQIHLCCCFFVCVFGWVFFFFKLAVIWMNKQDISFIWQEQLDLCCSICQIQSILIGPTIVGD